MTDVVIDNKVVKRHYPRDNRDEKLSFVFESDPNLCLLKNKIAIHFKIELDDKYIPDNGFSQKQFSIMDIELNSQLVSSNKAKFVFFFCLFLLFLLSGENFFSMTGY